MVNGKLYFSFWDIREIFEWVAHFILIHVHTVHTLTALKYFGIVSWCNNKNQVSIINGLHIHLSDFKKNVFDISISSYFLSRTCSEVVVLSNILLFLQLKEQKQIQIFSMILQNWNHSSTTVFMISCCSMYWIDNLDSILIE